jgi:hypothetical protein
MYHEPSTIARRYEDEGKRAFAPLSLSSVKIPSERERFP